MDTTRIQASVEDDTEVIETVAKRLWETPEIALEETAAAETVASTLHERGFSVERGVCGLETAVIGEFGTGEGPIIGVLGELDALPGLSQSASTTREPIVDGGPGHGCGHNLHCAGSLGGALAVKRLLATSDLEGTIRYFGCPAEETLVGKVYMANAGVFDDLDAALAWHPSDVTTVRLGTASALDSIEYRFSGTAAHAAAAPESGRSALDAVQLMNTGIEFLREHMPEFSRVHYVITDGGDAPNVVPSDAATNVFVRAPTRADLTELTAWVDDIATGASLMTQTEVDRRYLTGCHGYRPNETLGRCVYDVMSRIGDLDFADSDHEFASRLHKTIEESNRNARLSRYPDDLRPSLREAPLFERPVEPFDRGDRSKGTADLGEVCWITPTVQFRCATWPVGTSPHTWQAVAASGTIGLRALPYVSAVFAGTIVELMSDTPLLDSIRSEHVETTDGKPYESPLPSGIDPAERLAEFPSVAQPK